MLKLTEVIENVMRTYDEIQSLLIVDKDGVPMASAGAEIRNRTQMIVSFFNALDQAMKLSMGDQKYWVFHYDTYQLVVLNMSPIAIFLIAGPQANTSALCSLRSRFGPLADECKAIVAQIQPQESN
ncbi:Ragulator complex protein LAMTOR3-B [Aphelenchoides fujianensis]|nr:Ragulator complex protein LAMTOR3-B [Aphelenchoides fujianensis]